MDSPVTKRIAQINREIEKTNLQLESKTIRHFKTETAFGLWKQKQYDKIAELEEELAILDYPEEYAELPIAIVAEELGLKPSQVNHLIFVEEICVSRFTDFTKQYFIHRDEIGRILDYGVEKLLERGEQEPEAIFAEAVNFVRNNDLKQAERAHARLVSRDSRFSIRAESLETAINLLKGNLEDALATIRAEFKYTKWEELTVYLTYLGRLVRDMKLEEHGAQAFVEQIKSITEKQTLDLYDRVESSRSKQIGKRLDDLQQRAMFLTTTVLRSLKKYKHAQQFKFYNERHSQMREEEFEGVIRNAIYTALQAESTYSDSAASKLFIDTLTSEIPRWYSLAESLEHLSLETSSQNDAKDTL
jgi:hypothetical protein